MHLILILVCLGAIVQGFPQSLGDPVGSIDTNDLNPYDETSSCDKSTDLSSRNFLDDGLSEDPSGSADTTSIDDATVQAKKEGACYIRSNIDDNQQEGSTNPPTEHEGNTNSPTDNVEGKEDTSSEPDENLPKKGGWFTCRNPKDIRVCCSEMWRYWTRNPLESWVDSCWPESRWEPRCLLQHITALSLESQWDDAGNWWCCERLIPGGKKGGQAINCNKNLYA